MTGTSDVLLLARVTGSLVVVLLVAVLAARLARRAGRRGGSAAIAVRERIGLTRDTSAVVLEVSGHLLLLGVSTQQVSLLAHLGTDADEAVTVVTAGSLPDASRRGRIPAQRTSVRVVGEGAPAAPLTRRELRAVAGRRRPTLPPGRRAGTGAALDPRTWQQGLEALRDLTTRRG
jgi:flagellar biogenesis protein FliO